MAFKLVRQLLLGLAHRLGGPGTMHQPTIGQLVLITDHADVPPEWRCAWCQVVNMSTEPTPRITVADAMGRSLEVDVRHVRVQGGQECYPARERDGRR
jgi:hypothetical protein